MISLLPCWTEVLVLARVPRLVVRPMAVLVVVMLLLLLVLAPLCHALCCRVGYNGGHRAR